MPRIYESEAVIEVRPLHQMPGNCFAPTPKEGEGEPWLRTEIEKMTSQSNLEKVGDNLELSKRWNRPKDQVAPILKNCLTAQSIRGSDLVSIRVRHTNKVDARDIAAEVVRAYAEYRTELEGRQPERMLVELNKAVRDQEDKVEERRKVLSNLVRGFRGYRGPDTAALDAQDFSEAKQDYEADQALLQKLKLKQIGATMERKIQNDCVLIHQPPVIADSPISPDITFNLLTGAILGFLFCPPIALMALRIFKGNKTVSA
jgi:uncharacterized protein involved in exopolysaccharide biosynthesis